MLTRFETLLIANRGEIACRIIRSARAMGLRTVAVYTDADAGAPHVALADDAVRVGAGPVATSYLDEAAILEAARASGAGAIHPGYGFLSENAGFARAVAEAGLVFVGPSPEAIETMGDKAAAKRAMLVAGVPCVPGYEGEDQSDATLAAQAAQIGFPVMVKASAGGGGRGMRLVATPEDLPQALERARAEALGAFGADHLILERAIARPRHVEFQVFADAEGRAIHLGERDCSVQRRHQKIVEEAPCPVMTPELRAAMGDAALRAASAVAYCGAGTVEFLLDESGNFYFLEMNTRLQVEHPVTEMITGLDLVEMQLSVAQGAPLGRTQDDVALVGHAIEVRLYAEDPAADFLPATGRLERWTPPEGPGLRIDSGVVEGQEISPFYDPMLAKIIAHGASRDEARGRLMGALERTALLGVASNRDFLIDLLAQEDFATGSATTAFLEEAYPDGVAASEPESSTRAIAAALALNAAYCAARASSPLADDSLFGLGAVPARIDLRDGEALHALRAAPIPGGWRIEDGEESHEIALTLAASSPARIAVNGRGEEVAFALTGRAIHLTRGAKSYSFARALPGQSAAGAGSGRIMAPMPGLVISVDVAPGAQVVEGQRLAVLEAMKMQHQICADISGRIAELAIAPGDQIGAGALLVVIEGESQ